MFYCTLTSPCFVRCSHNFGSAKSKGWTSIDQCTRCVLYLERRLLHLLSHLTAIWVLKLHKSIMQIHWWNNRTRISCSHQSSKSREGTSKTGTTCTGDSPWEEPNVVEKTRRSLNDNMTIESLQSSACVTTLVLLASRYKIFERTHQSP